MLPSLPHLAFNISSICIHEFPPDSVKLLTLMICVKLILVFLLMTFSIGRLNNTGTFVECHNVGSVMTFRSNLNVTACAIEMLRLSNCLKALTKASGDKVNAPVTAIP